MEYSKEEVMSFIETCKKNGIQDAARLYQIQAAMRAGLTINLLEALGSPGLTELQMQQIAGLAVNGFPEEEILAVCKEPERLSQRREAYYKKTYGVDQKKIYQEVFNGFQTRWQRNFDQLLKQTETLSNTLDFLKEQVRQKEQEIQAALKQTEELRRQTAKERERAKDLELERAGWEVQKAGAGPEGQEGTATGEAETEDQRTTVEKEQMPADRGREEKRPFGILSKVSALCRPKGKHPERKLVALIGHLNEGQIEQVLDGYEQGLSLEDIKSYAKPDYSRYQMQEMKNLLLKNKQLPQTYKQNKG